MLDARLFPPDHVAELGACRGVIPFGASELDGSPRAGFLANEAAKTICRGCPVQADCLSWALQTPDPAFDLVAGGATYKERLAIRKDARRGQLTLTGV